MSRRRATAIVGLDIGTTSAKAAAYDPDGIILDSAEREYPLASPRPGRAEQDPEEVLDGVCDALGEVAAAAGRRGVRIGGVALSSAMHSLIALDGEDQPLTPSITYADNRAGEEAEALRDDGGLAVYRRTGTPIHPMSPLVKLRWFARHDPKVTETARRWVSIKEYVLLRLLGSRVVDLSIASATGLLNLEARDWDAEALELAGVEADALGELVPTTHVLEGLVDGAAQRVGLDAGTPFVVGASDGVLANLGVGAIEPGVVACSIGTSGAVRGIADAPRTDEQGRLFCYALTDDLWIVGGAINNGGIVLRWVRDVVLPDVADEATEAGRDPYDALTALAAEVAPGAGGLLFLPYLTGERAPHWSSLPQGVLFGLQRSHGREHIVRAALEGVLHQLCSVLRLLPECGVAVEQVRATGGFTASELWRQTMADVFDQEIGIPVRAEGSAFGAALLGMHALGHLPDLAEAADFVEIGARHEPDPAAARVHAAIQPIFERLYDRLLPEFSALAELQDALHDAPDR